MTNTLIWATNSGFDIGSRVVTWEEPNGYSFYAKKNYTPRKLTIEELQQKTSLFVLHHSVTYTAKQCFDVLQARNLSVNFLIDDDNVDGVATIYQCLDMKDAGWSHGPYNLQGAGVEICYRPEAWQNENLYSEANCKKYKVNSHEITEDTIHGQKIKVFGPSEPQIRACINLLWGISELFPDLKREFPKSQTVVDPRKLPGWVGHYHLTKAKIDPAGFPWERVEQEVLAKFGAGY